MKPRITSEGFFRPTADELYQHVIAKANSHDLAIKPYSNDDLIARFLADMFLGLYEQMDQVRVSNNIKEASGGALDALATLKSMRRKAPTPSEVSVTLTFSADTDAGADNTSPAYAGADNTSPAYAGADNTSPAYAGADNTSPAYAGADNTSPAYAGADDTSPAYAGADDTSPAYAGYTFAADELVVSDGNHEFTNPYPFTLKADPLKSDSSQDQMVSQVVYMKSRGTGLELNLAAGKITTIKSDPSNKIESVINERPALNGADAESDAAFRQRIMEKLPSNLSLVNLEKALNQLEDVRFARVLSNNSDKVQHGIPPGFSAIVIDDGVAGPLDEILANQIWKTLLDHSSMSVKWYAGTSTETSSETSIPLSYKHNDISITYPVFKPENVHIGLKITLADLEVEHAVLSPIVRGLAKRFIDSVNVGYNLKASGLFVELMSLEEVKNASSVKVEMKRLSDSDTSDNAYQSFISLGFKEKARVLDENITVVVE